MFKMTMIMMKIFMINSLLKPLHKHQHIKYKRSVIQSRNYSPRYENLMRE
jgi:hypothetical protein